MKSIGVLINPAAGGGRGKRCWKDLEPRLREMSFDIHYQMSTEMDDMSQLTERLLDVVLLHNFTKMEAFLKFPKIYLGTHLQEKNVKYVQSKSILVEPVGREIIPVEADGESIGLLPARFEMMPDLLSIVL